jgi:hypothetical protein
MTLQWQCFLLNRADPHVILHGNTNMEEYKDILTPCVLCTVEDQFSDDDCVS